MTDQGPLPDPYAVLGISRDAGSADVSRAYRRLARVLHPDSHPANADAADRLRAVIAAHDLLSDPARRAAHDRKGARGPVSPAAGPTPGIFAKPAASQLHPLSPADAAHGMFPTRPSEPVRPGPVRVEPLPGTDISRDEATISRAELQLLHLIGQHLRYRRYWPW